MLTVIDQRTRTPVATIRVPCPEAMEISSGRLFVLGWCDLVATVIDTATDKVLREIRGGYSTTSAFNSIAFCDNRIYLATTGEIHVFDSMTLSSVGSLAAGAGPLHMAVVGRKLYVANAWSNNVDIFDLDKGSLRTVTDLPLGGAYGPRPVYVVPTETKVYVLNRGAAAVTVIDVATDKVVATIPVGQWPEHMVAIAGRGYVANRDSNTVSVIDLSKDTVVLTIAVGKRPVFMTASGAMLYVVNEGSSTVSVIDTSKIR